MPIRSIPAITVYQPYASLMAGGHKTYEWRTWFVQYRGPLIIHAAKMILKETWLNPLVRDALQRMGYADIEALPTGGIVGLVRLDGYRPVEYLLGKQMSPLDLSLCTRTPGGFGWVLKDARQLPFVACRGAQGVWRYDLEVSDEQEES